MLPSAAGSHTGHGHDSEAETELRIALELNPRDVENRNRLAAILFLKKKYKEAEREYAAVLKTVPENVNALDGMGLLRLQEARYDDAISCFTRAIASNDRVTLPHCHLGQAYERLGRPVDAASSYKRALKVNDDLLRRGANREKEQQNRQLILDALRRLEPSGGAGRKRL